VQTGKKIAPKVLICCDLDTDPRLQNLIAVVFIPNCT